MKFRRKSRTDEPEVEESPAEAQEESTPTHGPWDVDDLPEGDELPRVDLGSLLIVPVKERDLRLQVDEKTQAVQAIVFTGKDGAMEVRVFAAPRNGDLWAEARPQIAAQASQRGGVTTERQGRWGTELIVQMPAKTPDGQAAQQVSRIIGVNGPRWMLRATLMGRAAVESQIAATWEGQLAQFAVRRGQGAMPAGEALPLTLPEQAKRIG